MLKKRIVEEGPSEGVSVRIAGLHNLDIRVEELLRSSKDMTPKETVELRQIFSNAMLKYGKYMRGTPKRKSKNFSKFSKTTEEQSTHTLKPKSPVSPKRKYLPQTSCSLIN